MTRPTVTALGPRPANVTGRPQSSNLVQSPPRQATPWPGLRDKPPKACPRAPRAGSAGDRPRPHTPARATGRRGRTTLLGHVARTGQGQRAPAATAAGWTRHCQPGGSPNPRPEVGGPRVSTAAAMGFGYPWTATVRLGRVPTPPTPRHNAHAILAIGRSTAFGQGADPIVPAETRSTDSSTHTCLSTAEFG